nr:ABC transporter C-terminal domain-containing protein [Paracoccaceae bacterium]
QGGGPVAAAAEARPARGASSAAAAAPSAAPAVVVRALSFTERHRLDVLPAEIDRLTAEIGKLTGLLADPDLFAREPVKFRKATEALAERQAKLQAAEEEWLALAERAEG